MGKDETVILLGGGYSVRDGLALGLWDKIKDLNVWSINFCYMKMPFTPKKELWLDTTFFRNNMDSLYQLEQKGCQMVTKKHGKYENLPSFVQYGVTRERLSLPFTDNNIYIGTNGLSGFFALSVAIHQGYKNIYLLGYDFGTNSISNTNTHWYQDDIVVKSSGVRNPSVYLNRDNKVKKEVNDFTNYNRTNATIITVGLASNITAFQKIDYPTFLQNIS